MPEYKILIVDDEPAAIENIAGLIRRIPGCAADVYRAGSASEALRLLEEGRMDLVITDIEMPGQNGLALTGRIRERWPQCQVIILTAFSQFQYAYSAIQLHAADYILKAESDESIIAKIQQILENTEAERKDSAQIAQRQGSHATTQEQMLTQLLSSEMEPARQAELLKQNGFPLRSRDIFLVLSQTENQSVSLAALNGLMAHYTQDQVSGICCGQLSGGNATWLLEPVQSATETEIAHISGLLELVQSACQNALGVGLSLAIMPLRIGECRLRDTCQSLLERMERIREGAPGVPFIYRFGKNQLGISAPNEKTITDAVVEWLRRYVEENITSDISLIRLSTLTGYSPQYLSNLFHQRMGITLTRYISTKRMERITEMLKDIRIPLQEVAQTMGFSSASYFSRFVRQESGLSPGQLRLQLAEPGQGGEQS